MNDIRRYSLAAIIGLVILRIGIGWQLLYEGLWKIDTFKTANPWSSEGYLKSAQGPMRGVFRAMTGDPDDKFWLDEAAVVARWDSWKDRFIRHYKLDEKQVSRLNALVDGVPAFVAPLEKLPEGVDFTVLKEGAKAISFDADKRQLRIDGAMHLLKSEKDTLDEQVADRTGPEYDAYRKALADAWSRSSRLSFKERLRAHLQGNPDNAGQIDGRISQLKLYNEMLARYENKLTSANLAFEYDHLTRTWSDARAKALELAGPVIALDDELQSEAIEQILTVDQVRLGPLSEPWSILKVVDLATIVGLAGLGMLLIVGLFTRFAALSAAFMIFGFYMAMPPFPGVPEAPGPEHSFIVNKNLVEVMALLALAFVPTGSWFGFDKLLSGFCCRRKPANPGRGS